MSLFDTYTHQIGLFGIIPQLFVLEDNLWGTERRLYMLENRSVMKAPELFRIIRFFLLVDTHQISFDMLNALSPRPVDAPDRCVDPGIMVSLVHFEHSYLAQDWGRACSGSRFICHLDDCVYMKAVEGVSRVDVIYRRIDDTFLDPEALNPESVLGVPGLMRAWRAGKVSIANAPGSGVADDKVLTHMFLKS